MLLTPCSPTAYSAVSWVLCVATNISHTRIIQSLFAKLAPVHVLDAPETSGSDSRGLCALGHVHRLCGCGRHACEWAEELCEKGHGEVKQERYEDICEKLQIGDSRLDVDSSATMTEWAFFMGLTVSPHQGSMMPSIPDKSRGAGWTGTSPDERAERCCGACLLLSSLKLLSKHRCRRCCCCWISFLCRACRFLSIDRVCLYGSSWRLRTVASSKKSDLLLHSQ